MTDLPSESDAGPSQRAVEIGVALFVCGLAAIVIVGALGAGIGWGPEGPRAGFFPFSVGLLILVSGIINLVQALAVPKAELFATWPQLRQVLSVIIPTTIYVLLVPWLGLYVSSFLLIAVFMRWLGHYRWPIVAAVSVGVPVVSYVMFEKWFLVALPKGPLEQLLGL
jgi:hypothetical protein